MNEQKKVCLSGTETDGNKNLKVICAYCNHETDLVWVHGHFQCKLCKYVVESCCEGGEIERGKINE